MLPSSDLPHGLPFDARSACVLVVEDEMLIRFMLGEMLRDAGYAVIEACSADEALTVLNAAVRIDLILSDVRMPGSLDGLGLLAAVRAKSAALPFIIASADCVPGQALAAGATLVLTKPYSFEDVVTIVREQLEKTA